MSRWQNLPAAEPATGSGRGRAAAGLGRMPVHRRPVPAVRRRRRPSALTAVALLGAAAFVLIGIGTPLLGLRSFSGADLVQVREPWKSLVPTGFQPQIQAVSDTVDSVLPARHYFRQQLLDGDVATWNPLSSGGTELGGTLTPAFYTPLNLPFLLLPTWLAPAYAKLLELIVTIAGTVAFTSRLRLSRPAGLVGGVIFAASGFMVTWTNWPQTQTAALIPALFWASERFVQQRTARSALPIAAVIAVMLLGGFPQVAGYACYAAGPYLLMRLAQLTGWSPLRLLRGAVTAGTALLLGVGLVGVVLLPLGSQLSELDYLSERGQGPQTHLPPLMLLTLPVWRAYGTVAGGPYWGPASQVEGLSYIGAAALVLIGFGLLRRPARDVPRGVRGYFVAAALLAIVLGYVGGPVLAAAQHLPVFSDNPVFRIRSVLGFFLAVLAAFGYDTLLRRADARDRRPVRVAVEVLGWLAAGVLGLLAVQRLLAVARNVDEVAYVERQLAYAGLAAGAAFVAGMVATAARRRPGAGTDADDEPPAGAHRTGRDWLRTGALAAVPLVVVVESLSLVLAFWPRIPKSEFYPVTGAHRFLAGSLGHERYGARGLTLFSGTNVYYGLRNTTGHSFTELPWKELLLTADPRSFVSPTFSTFSRFADEKTLRSPLLDLLSVRYFATAQEEPLFGRAGRAGAAGPGLLLRPGQPVTVPIGAGGVRGVGPVVTEEARPTDPFAALDLDLLDPRGTVVGHGSRRLYAEVETGALTVPVAGDQLGSAGPLTARLTLRSDSPIRVAGGSRPQLELVRPDPTDGLRLVFAEGAVIYQRTTAFSRFRWADHTEVIPDKTRRLTVLANVRDPGRVVLDGPAPAPADGRRATVQVTADGSDDMAATVDASGAGYLVVADALQNGWTATVDGRPAALVAADHAMVAVPVPAGRHEVRLDYRVPGQRSGTVLSLLSLLALVAMGLAGGRGHPRDRPGGPGRPG